MSIRDPKWPEDFKVGMKVDIEKVDVLESSDGQEGLVALLLVRVTGLEEIVNELEARIRRLENRDKGSPTGTGVGEPSDL
jgi:hypothetical protein